MDSKTAMAGRYPAIVKSYDKTSRTCRISIPGVTERGDVLPLAEIEYPIGDKSVHPSYATELEITPNDMVWVSFINNDPRYPIITGYRNPEIGNDIDTRRYHHKNIQLVADTQIELKVGASTLVITASGITLNGSRIDLN